MWYISKIVSFEDKPVVIETEKIFDAIKYVKHEYNDYLKYGGDDIRYKYYDIDESNGGTAIIVWKNNDVAALSVVSKKEV